MYERKERRGREKRQRTILANGANYCCVLIVLSSYGLANAQRNQHVTRQNSKPPFSSPSSFLFSTPTCDRKRTERSTETEAKQKKKKKNRPVILFLFHDDDTEKEPKPNDRSPPGSHGDSRRTNHFTNETEQMKTNFGNLLQATESKFADSLDGPLAGPITIDSLAHLHSQGHLAPMLPGRHCWVAQADVLGDIVSLETANAEWLRQQANSNQSLDGGLVIGWRRRDGWAAFASEKNRLRRIDVAELHCEIDQNIFAIIRTFLGSFRRRIRAYRDSIR